MKLLYAYSHLLNDSKSVSEDLSIYREIYNFDADAWLVDRTKIVIFPIGEILDPEFSLPVVSNKISFSEACLKRADSLLSESKSIYILWSGGIDSTAIICSFLATGRSLEKITIVLNHDSVKEYPLFYEKFIRGKFKIKVTEQAMLEMSTGTLEGTVLSGEHGDQLFGSPVANGIHQTMPQGFLKSNFSRENFNLLFSVKRMSQRAIDCWFDLYSQTIKHSPRPIDTMFDFAWWHGFNFRWQGIGLKMLPRIERNIDFKTFYSGVELQSWSIYHEPDLNSLDSLKSEPKRFVFSVTKDIDYQENKIKHPSSTLYYGKPAAAGIDQNKNHISLNNFKVLDYYNPDNSIARWLELNQKEVK